MLQPQNPYAQMLFSMVPDHFFGRRAEIEFLLQGISTDEANSFVISGPRKLGKSALLQYFRHPEGALKKYADSLSKFQPGSSENPLFSFYFDAYKLSGEQVLAALPGLLARSRELSEKLGSPKMSAGQSSDPAVYRKHLTELFQLAMDKNTRLVIFLDHFDTAYQSMDYPMDVFYRSLSSLHSLVFISSKSLSSLKSNVLQNSPLLSILKERMLKPLSAAEALELISRPASETGLPFSASDIEFIARTAGQHPYLLTLVCEFLFAYRLENPDSENIISADPAIQKQVCAQLLGLSPVNSLFQLIYGQLSENEQRVLILIASGKSIQAPDQTIATTLINQHRLVSIDLKTGNRKLFCELFHEHIRQTQLADKGIEMILANLSGYDGKLLTYLMAYPNETRTFKQISLDIWGKEDEKRAIEASIHRLRNILEENKENPDVIQNVRGQGYRYAAEE